MPAVAPLDGFLRGFLEGDGEGEDEVVREAREEEVVNYEK